MRIGKKVLAAGLLLSSVAAWLLLSQTSGRSTSEQAGTDVPVQFEGVQSTRVDDSPVSTTLHEYMRGTDIITGQSIIFSFPANHYAWAENARGGPQYRIVLGVQADTFEPLLRLEKQVRDDKALTFDQRKEALRALRSRDLGITMYSPTKSVNVVAGAASVFKEYEEGRAKPIGRMCDLAIFLDNRGAMAEGSDLHPEAALRRPDITVVALSGESKSFDDLIAARCAAHSPICVIQIPYAGWSMSFHIRRADFCSWKHTSTSIKAYLDSHIIAQTHRSGDLK